MKKLWILLVLVIFLMGCGSEQTFETLADVYGPQAAVTPQEISCTFGDGVDALLVENENGKLYICDGYEVTLQTLPGGDLQATLNSLTGYDKAQLTVLESGRADAVRYECVWTAAGESGDLVGRAAILDDGVYHYCMTMTADADVAGSLQHCWGELLQSFSLV